MSTGLWLMLAGGATGGTVAIFGLIALALNRRRRRNEDMRQTSVRSGLYAVCFGTGLVLVSLSGLLNAFDLTVPALLVLAATMTLVGVAVFRYRPRVDAPPHP